MFLEKTIAVSVLSGNLISPQGLVERAETVTIESVINERKVQQTIEKMLSLMVVDNESFRAARIHTLLLCSPLYNAIVVYSRSPSSFTSLTPIYPGRMLLT